MYSILFYEEIMWLGRYTKRWKVSLSKKNGELQQYTETILISLCTSFKYKQLKQRLLTTANKHHKLLRLLIDHFFSSNKFDARLNYITVLWNKEAGIYQEVSNQKGIKRKGAFIQKTSPLWWLVWVQVSIQKKILT